MTTVAGVAGQVGDYRRLLRIRDYRLLWQAQAVSTFGDRLTQLALAALVYDLTGSEISLGLVLTIGEAPRALFGLLAGTVADRVSRKTLLVVTDCVRALIVLTLALWAGVPLAAVYLLTALHATATVFFSPARYAALPDIVPRGDLLSANTLDEATQSVLDPVAYAAGGALVAAAGARTAFRVDAATFLLSAGLIAMTTARAAALWRAQRDVRRPVHKEAGEGVRLLFADRVLAANMVLMLIAGLIASADTPLVYMLVFTRWQRGVFGLGVLEATLAAGFVLGAVTCRPLVARTGKGKAILLGLLGTGVCTMLVALAPFWPAVLAYGVSGVFNVYFFVPGITMTQERAPRNARGRVLSTRNTLMALSLFGSYALATLLVVRVAPEVLMVAMGAALTATTLAATAVPELRER